VNSSEIRFQPESPVVCLHAMGQGLVDRLCRIIAAFEKGIELTDADRKMVERINGAVVDG
jgi:hypothetical protein